MPAERKYPEIVNAPAGTKKKLRLFAEAMRRRTGEKWTMGMALERCIEHEMHRERIAVQQGVVGPYHPDLMKPKIRPLPAKAKKGGN